LNLLQIDYQLIKIIVGSGPWLGGRTLQSVGLYHSWKLIGSPGKITRLLSCDEQSLKSEFIESEFGFVVLRGFSASYSEHNKTDLYFICIPTLSGGCAHIPPDGRAHISQCSPSFVDNDR
jgi:hypothetical protein